MRIALLAPVLMFSVLSALPAQQRAPARVFVHTEEGGEPSELADRQQSVKDLTAALAAKKRAVTIVKTSDEAEIVVEVLDRGVTVPRVVIGIGARPGQPPGNNTQVRHVSLRVQVSRNRESVTLKNKNTPFDSPSGWRSAADDLAKQIEKWIAERGTVSSHEID